MAGPRYKQFTQPDAGSSFVRVGAAALGGAPGDISGGNGTNEFSFVALTGVLTISGPSVQTTLGGDVTIQGNLEVQGTTTTVDSQLQTADRYILLNSDYTSDIALDAGLVMNIDPSATAFSIDDITSNVITVVAGDPSSVLSVADFILIQNPGDVDNVGVYEVLLVDATTITIDTVPADSWSGGALVDDATTQGTVVGVRLSVIRSSAAGAMQTAHGTAAPLVFGITIDGTAATIDFATTGAIGGTTATTITVGRTGQAIVMPGFVNIGAATQSVADGDFATSDGSNVFFYNASANSVVLNGSAATISSDNTITITSTGALSLDSSTNAIQTNATSITADAALSILTTGATALTLDTGGAAAVNVGNTNANAVSLSRNGVTTTVNGALAVTQASTFTLVADFDAGLTVAAGQAITGDGALSILTTGATALNLDTGGAAAINVGGTNATSVVVMGGSNSGTVTIGNSAAGAIILDTTAGIAMTADTSSSFTVTDASAILTLEASGGTANQVIINSAGTGADAVRINASAGGIDIDSFDSVTITAAANGDITLSAGPNDSASDIFFSAHGSGNVAFNTDGVPSLVGFTATAIIPALNEALAAATGGDSLQEVYANQAGAQVTGSDALDFSLTGAITLSSTISSSLSTTGSAQTLTLAASGGSTNQVIINSAGTGSDAIDINATAGGIDIDAAGGISLDAAGGISLDAVNTSASNFTSANTTDSTDTTLTIASNNTGGVAGDATIDIDANSANGASAIDIGVLNCDTVTIGRSGVTTVIGGSLQIAAGNINMPSDSRSISWGTGGPTVLLHLAGDDSLRLFDGGSTNRDLLVGKLTATDSLVVEGTNGELVERVSSTEVIATTAGATVTTSGLIPAGVRLLFVVCRVDTTVVTSGATDTFDVGDSGDDDRYGLAIAGASGTTVDQTDYTADPEGVWSAAAREIILDAAAAETFTAGAVRVTAFYEVPTAPTS